MKLHSAGFFISSRLMLCAGMILFVSFANAHPGDLDSQGGHWNQANGEYHFHHGWPAHYHTGGQCPYAFRRGPNVSSPSTGIKGEYQGLYTGLTPPNEQNHGIRSSANRTIIGIIAVPVFYLAIFAASRVYSRFDHSDSSLSSLSDSKIEPIGCLLAILTYGSIMYGVMYLVQAVLG